MTKGPLMIHDQIRGWIAESHYAFIGWDILGVEEVNPGTVRVHIRRRFDPRHWIPPKKRIVRYVLSSVEYIPISIWQMKPFHLWTLKRKDSEE